MEIYIAQQGDHHLVISCIQPEVHDEDNSMLTHPFTELEFKDAIFSVHLDKSLGSDGLNPTFYKKKSYRK